MLWLLTLLDGAIHRQWLVVMGRLPAVRHLAHLLCELYVRLRVAAKAGEEQFSLPITQNDLADMLGISLVHVNRVVQELRGKGVISWQDKTVHILDWPGLQRIAEFDAGYLHLETEPR
jgi:CRP-like cAMP-binding protein